MGDHLGVNPKAHLDFGLFFFAQPLPLTARAILHVVGATSLPGTLEIYYLRGH